ncbi:CoA pyrophosphatase [Chromobacterium haemolyticum]|uniref:CoA pyrophosphatase n=1 Tax=Chromobacterium haemolyticum TaxID=394935 RepID=UPI000AD9AB83|nr:CoA pyrophosphatase [Chromobacterium haemolyticum]
MPLACWPGEWMTAGDNNMWSMEAGEAADWIAGRLSAYDFTGRVGDFSFRQADGGLRPAAVLVPLVWHSEGPTVLLTRRAENLPAHAGQVSFPGGKLERDDGSAERAALRETREETGLAESHVRLLGRLPDYVTITGFVVTPVVGLVLPPFELSPEPGEVAEVFEAPLPLLMDTGAYQRHSHQGDDGQLRAYLSLDWQSHRIWGATAAMLWLLSDALGVAGQDGAPFRSCPDH